LASLLHILWVHTNAIKVIVLHGITLFPEPWHLVLRRANVYLFPSYVECVPASYFSLPHPFSGGMIRDTDQFALFTKPEYKAFNKDYVLLWAIVLTDAVIGHYNHLSCNALLVCM
ncbi:MAG: hypothetical protein K8R16_01360, partial [Anaerolineales bacterium]|nr:hypothetical protein [Anaerolineales bacterium]